VAKTIDGLEVGLTGKKILCREDYFFWTFIGNRHEFGEAPGIYKRALIKRAVHGAPLAFNALKDEDGLAGSGSAMKIGKMANIHHRSSPA
jgi:hypothetical protein